MELLSFPLYRVFEFQHGKIKFDLRLCFIGLKIITKKIIYNFATALHERLLLEFVWVLRHLANRTRQLSQLGISLNNRNRRLCCLVTLQDRGEHVQSFFGESLRHHPTLAQVCGQKF